MIGSYCSMLYWIGGLRLPPYVDVTIHRDVLLLFTLAGPFFPHGWGDLNIVKLEEDLSLISTWPPQGLKVGKGSGFGA